MFCNTQRMCFSLYLRHILAAADQQKDRVRLFFQQHGKDIKEERVVFRLIKSANMSNRDFVFKAKLPPHFLTLGWVIGVSRDIYSIVYDLI